VKVIFSRQLGVSFPICGLLLFFEVACHPKNMTAQVH